MLPYLLVAIERSGQDEQSFFRSAYMWAFKKDADISTDLCQWKLHNVIPPYLQSYIRHLQSEMT